jgi:hypothetical protein
MSLLSDIKRNWAALGAIGVIVGGTFYALDALDARAAEVAKKEVQATINVEMVAGAKKAAREAVQEAMAEQKAAMSAIVKEAAREVAKEVVRAQRAEDKAAKAKP